MHKCHHIIRVEIVACDVKVTSFKVFKRGAWESAVYVRITWDTHSL